MAALENWSLVGKTVYLPRIFTREMHYNSVRFKFTNNWIPVVVSEDLLRLFSKISLNNGEMHSIEGPSGVGKYFLLYFLVCYFLSRDDYWVGFLAFPSSTKKTTKHRITEFSRFYYLKIVEYYEQKGFDFKSDFDNEHSQFLDYKDDGEIRKYILVIDKFNNFIATYLSNKKINGLPFQLQWAPSPHCQWLCK